MPLPDAERALLHQLLRAQRQGALATLHNGAPAVSMVAYAMDDTGGMLLHLSSLSQHTGDIRAHARVALLVCQPDTAASNPQLLHRVSIDGNVQEIGRNTTAYAAAQQCYLARLPESAITFSLGDFSLFRIAPIAARFVAGFGRAYDVTADELRIDVTQ